MKRPDLAKFRGFFSERAFWGRIGDYARRAGSQLTYTALLLYFAYQRKETPAWAKRIVLGSLGYLLAPIDLIPDLSPFIGLTDDIGVLSLSLVTISAYVNDEVRHKAKAQLSRWFRQVKEEDLREVDDKL